MSAALACDSHDGCAGDVRPFSGDVAFCEQHWPDGWQEVKTESHWCGEVACAVGFKFDPFGYTCPRGCFMKWPFTAAVEA